MQENTDQNSYVSTFSPNARKYSDHDLSGSSNSRRGVAVKNREADSDFRHENAGKLHILNSDVI